MPAVAQRVVSAEEFDRAEAEYLEWERQHDMSESEWCFIQRAITVHALSLLKLWHFPSVFVYNEMLLLYPMDEGTGRVVPDNFITFNIQPPEDLNNSYRVTPTKRPFWVLEYVSESSERKDYKESFSKYEEQLQVPYCTLFNPVSKALEMHRHNGVTYDELAKNNRGRYGLPELDLEVGLLEGWVRFWHRGELLPTTEELGTEVRERTVAQTENNRQLEAIRQRELNRVVKLATAARRMDIVTQAPDASLEQLQNWMDDLLE